MSDVHIDAVLDELDRTLERGPTYRDLYRRWEKQHWLATGLDFERDRLDWLALGSERRSTCGGR